MDFKKYRDVWVFAEQRQGKLMPVVLELLGEGRRLAKESGCLLCAVLAGDNVELLAQELISYGAQKVYLIEDPLLKDYTTDGYANVIVRAVETLKPEIVLYGATHIGRDLAPRIASRVNTGLTADCTRLEIDPEDKKLKQTRPAFGGNIMATIICPNHRPQMSTVREGVMKKAVFQPDACGEIVRLESELSEKDLKVKVLDIIHSVQKRISLTDAEVIVSGGLGVASVENFQLLEQLAEALGGVTGGSRGAVDAGLIEKNRQIGQTGTTVKPRLYIACGISGAVQHLVGMQSSDQIIAVNTNPQAPIFQVADIGIVGDLKKIVPLMTQTLRGSD